MECGLIFLDLKARVMRYRLRRKELWVKEATWIKEAFFDLFVSLS